MCGCSFRALHDTYIGVLLYALIRPGYMAADRSFDAASMIKEISICMGSSCFCRGNEQNIKIVEEFLLQHDIESRVLLKGRRCELMCDKGPVISIDGEQFYGVDGPMLRELLNSRLD